MTAERPPELFVSERPVRSFDARERTYARRRIATMLVLAGVIGGIVSLICARGPGDPAAIPTIQSAGAYKQKPANPGGIDIPHQDVRVYDQLEAKNNAAPPVEHLLPPPETPRDLPPPPLAPPAATQSAPAAAPPPAAPQPSPPAGEIVPTAPVKTVATTVMPGVATPAPAKESLSIEQVIEKTKAAAPSSVPTAAAVASSGAFALQLASLPDQGKANEMMQALQKKYSAQLDGAHLHVAAADLGSRGVFYRIQSQTLAQSDAAHICAALKQMNAGCILVRK